MGKGKVARYPTFSLRRVLLYITLLHNNCTFIWHLHLCPMETLVMCLPVQNPLKYKNIIFKARPSCKYISWTQAKKDHLKKWLKRNNNIIYRIIEIIFLREHAAWTTSFLPPSVIISSCWDLSQTVLALWLLPQGEGAKKSVRCQAQLLLHPLFRHPGTKEYVYYRKRLCTF